MNERESQVERLDPADDASQSSKTLLRLREMLFKGEFQRGERLSELPLVARLGVSRTPIRVALQRLAHEGLLEPSRSGGFVVREFTVDAVWDAIEIRGVLEGTAARMAAERLDKDSELHALRQYRDEMDSIGKPPMSEESFSRCSTSTRNSIPNWSGWRKTRCCAGRWSASRHFPSPRRAPFCLHVRKCPSAQRCTRLVRNNITPLSRRSKPSGCPGREPGARTRQVIKTQSGTRFDGRRDLELHSGRIVNQAIRIRNRRNGKRRQFTISLHYCA